MVIFMLVNVGYGNVVNMDKVIGIVHADAAPIKRVMDSGHLVLSALLPETIESRVDEPYERRTDSPRRTDFS